MKNPNAHERKREKRKIHQNLGRPNEPRNKKPHRLRITLFLEKIGLADALKIKLRKSNALPDRSASVFYEKHRNSGEIDLGMWGRKIPPTGIFERDGNKRKNVTSRCVFGNVKARAKSFASMFGVRSASLAPLRAGRPDVFGLHYRWESGGGDMR